MINSIVQQLLDIAVTFRCFPYNEQTFYDPLVNHINLQNESQISCLLLNNCREVYKLKVL